MKLKKNNNLYEALWLQMSHFLITFCDITFCGLIDCKTKELLLYIASTTNPVKRKKEMFTVTFCIFYLYFIYLYLFFSVNFICGHEGLTDLSRPCSISILVRNAETKLLNHTFSNSWETWSK